MYRFKKTLISIIACFSFLAVAAIPMRADALVPPLLQFGGYTTFWLPCTCSATFWVWFAPLYLTAVPVTGPLTYVPYGTMLFGNFIPPLVPATPHEGAYIPGVPACWMYAGVTCFPMPDIGVMGFVGSGLPGGK